MISRFEKFLLWVLLAALFVALALFADAYVSYYDARAEDIYYAWWWGRLLVLGQNFYGPVLDAGMRTGDQGWVATYLPLFYLLSAATQWLGLREFEAWIKVWRFVFALFGVGVGALLLGVFFGRGRALLGALAAAFWLLNRWTLHSAQVGHIEFIPIFLLVLSLVIFERHRRLSLVLFGVSLALKQVAIFLVPLYVIWVWQEAGERRLKEACYGALLIAAVPLIVSLPFIAWNGEAFFRSIFSSAARGQGTHFDVPSVDTALGLRGALGRLPMLAMMALVYVCALRRNLGRYLSALLIMVVFTDFSPVLFRQYFCWIVPLVPLCALDYLGGQRRTAPPARAP